MHMCYYILQAKSEAQAIGEGLGTSKKKKKIAKKILWKKAFKRLSHGAQRAGW